MQKPKQADALKAVIRWVNDPSEKNRQAAGTAGKAASFAVPMGGIAMSAFWSGGSLLPPGEKVVPPDPMLTANTLSGVFPAIAAEGPIEQAKETLARFLALGISIAKGKYLWTTESDDNHGAQHLPEAFAR